jgi:hypothetical protein
LWQAAASAAASPGPHALAVDPGASHGFVYDEDHGKWGWRAAAPSAVLAARFRAGRSPWLELTYMRSYGERWANATVELYATDAHVPAAIRNTRAARSRPCVWGRTDDDERVFSLEPLVSRWARPYSLDVLSEAYRVVPGAGYCLRIALAPGSGSAFKLRGARAC